MTAPIRLELPTGFEFGSVNAYLLTGPEPALVDTGLKSEASWQALQSGLAQHHLSITDLRRVIITHPHIDHCGQAGLIAAHSQAEIWIEEKGASWLLDYAGHLQARAEYYRRVFLPPLALPAGVSDWLLAYLAHMNEGADSVPAERIRTFRAGETLPLGDRSWQILPAPGHTSVQTCFYQPGARQLLSADMLLAKAPAPVVEKPPVGAAASPPALAQFLESLQRIEALDIDRVYPGHGEPFSGHRQVIQRQRERLRQRQAECLSLIAAGHRTVADLLDQMYALYPPRFHLTGLWMLIGYLDLLEAEGQVEKQQVDGVWRYVKRILPTDH
ncbi:MAG: MBL fold metallo-hydrolase [Chloroflexota bacterium]